jgi:hypothetical protein
MASEFPGRLGVVRPLSTSLWKLKVSLLHPFAGCAAEGETDISLIEREIKSVF